VTGTRIAFTLPVAEDPEQKLVTFAASPQDQARIARLLDAGY
jgi:hypothetical protein